MDLLAVNLPLAYKARYGSKQRFEAEVLGKGSKRKPLLASENCFSNADCPRRVAGFLLGKSTDIGRR